MTIVCWLLFLLVSCGWLYWGVAVWAAEKWRRGSTPAEARFEPISIIKPLCGEEPELEANLASFCEQHYPCYEVIFVAEDPEDPALEVARRVAAAHPDCSITVLSGSPPLGLNRKVRNLAHAEKAARHPLFVISDSDMRVEPDYLARVAAPFDDPDVGVLTCLYRSFEPRGLGACLEALSIGTEFTPSVLVAWLIEGPCFGFGSTIAIRRTVLDRLGGFQSIADELADDYRLAERARDTGAREVLSDYVVDYVPGRQPLGAVVGRSLRWARTIRAINPAGAAGAVVTHVFTLSLVLAALRHDARSLWLAAFTLLWRSACASLITTRCTGDRSLPRLLWLLPFHDIYSFCIWLYSLGGSRVAWRGHTFSFGHGGKIFR